MRSGTKLRQFLRMFLPTYVNNSIINKNNAYIESKSLNYICVRRL